MKLKHKTYRCNDQPTETTISIYIAINGSENQKASQIISEIDPMLRKASASFTYFEFMSLSLERFSYATGISRFTSGYSQLLYQGITMEL